MSDPTQNPIPNNDRNRDDRNLRDISHLFLSSVRDRSTGGAPRPQRTPPAKQDHPPAVDFGAEAFTQPQTSASPLDSIGPARAVIAPHLNGTQRDRVREYAAHLCKSGERIGLIEIDANEFRLSCFELGSPVSEEKPATIEQLDARQISESLEEMSWDIDRWLVHVPSPRLAEARALLRNIDRLTVLATCDHDGVVACYRSLKGLADLQGHHEAHPTAQTLSLALLDSDDEDESQRVFAKLAGVCRQFLHWPLENEADVEAAGSIVEHQVLCCRASKEKSGGAHWQIVSEFLNRAKPRKASMKPARPMQPQATPRELKNDEPAIAPPAGVAISADPAASLADDLEQELSGDFNQVIDLPAGIDTAAAIVSAALHGDRALVECPVKPPMLADATLAVARDRRLILLAVAKQGLSDLRLIGETWRWMNENRALIAMAVPQLSIDPHQMPHLRLLIDRADVSAETLQPLLQTGNVTVQTYRKLRWGEKTGLLLEAA